MGKLRLLAVLQTPGAGHLPTAGSGPRRTCPYGLGDLGADAAGHRSGRPEKTEKICPTGCISAVFSVSLCMSIPESAEEKDRLIMEQHAELLSVRSELEALKKAIYGSTSERYRKVVDNADQLRMFEGQDQVPAPEEQEQQVSYKRRRPVTNADHPGRNRLPSHLPVEETTTMRSPL